MKTIRKTMLEKATDLCVPQPAWNWEDADDGSDGYCSYNHGIDPIVAEHVRLCRERERFEESQRALYAPAPSPYDGRDRYDADGAPDEDTEDREEHPDISHRDDWHSRY